MSAPGILAPAPQAFYDNNGNPLSGGKLFFYAPGGTTKQNTYTDSTIGTPNLNPVICDAAGRVGAIYLDPALGYKLVIAPSTDTDPPTSPIDTQDNYYLPAMVLPQTLSKSANYTVLTGDGFTVLIEVDATSGAVTIAPYTAIGNTGKAITVKKIDSSANVVTIDPNGAQTIDGATTQILYNQYDSLTIMSDGANWAIIGRATATTASASVNDGRLTLTSGTPVTIADVTSSTSVYFTPFKGTSIGLYDGTKWNLRTFAEIAISLAGFTASQCYDIFAYDNAGVVTIETLIWTSAVARATAIVKQDGVWVKSGATTRRLLGTIYINGAGGRADDSFTKRNVSNVTNRVPRALRQLEGTASWTYTTQTWRQANASTSAQLEVTLAVAEVPIALQAKASWRNGAATASVIDAQVGIGEDSTTSLMTGLLYDITEQCINDRFMTVQCHAHTFPAVGRHVYARLEQSTATNTTTWLGTGAPNQAGISGEVWA